MLKKRIIPIQLLSKGRLVKTKKFSNPRDVGDPVMSSKVYSDQDADELLLLHIDKFNNSIEVLLETVEKISKECFVPFSVGGGISCVEDAERLFFAGADKVVLNSITHINPNVIREISDLAGIQAVVACIDVKIINKDYSIYSERNKIENKTTLRDHINKLIDNGVGEIIIQSIDRDGNMNGYDLNLLKQVNVLSTVPVIAAGGAGNFEDLRDAFEVGVSAVACGSLFNFGDNNPLRAKSFLKNYKVPLKLI